MFKNQNLIWLLASFLILYHTVKIYTGLTESSVIFDWSHIYTVRLWIVFSLFLVIMFKRLGIISMWASILILIATQYLSLPEGLGFAGYLAPLKEIIFPSIITWFFLENKKG